MWVTFKLNCPLPLVQTEHGFEHGIYVGFLHPYKYIMHLPFLGFIICEVMFIFLEMTLVVAKPDIGFDWHVSSGGLLVFIYHLVLRMSLALVDCWRCM